MAKVLEDESQVGAGGGTRTHTTFYGPRILSPVRLPFRHTGAYRFMAPESKHEIELASVPLRFGETCLKALRP